MAGHSKWSNIKHKKGAEDAKRGKLFSQISKLIRSAVKEGKSGDPSSNPSLRVAMDKARAANMPKDNVQRAIDRGLGKTSSGATLQENVYEGFGPNGVGFLVVAVTDNANRTGSQIRHIFSKFQGSLGSPGSVSYMFTRSESGDYVTSMPMPIDDPQAEQQLQGLLDELRNCEDVEDVYCVGDWQEKE